MSTQTNWKNNLKLLICGEIWTLKYSGRVDTLPPYYCFSVVEDKGISWIPFTNPVDLPKQFSWRGEENFPQQLVAPQGPVVSCQVVNNQEVIKDYGDMVYLRRGGSSCISGDQTQEIKRGLYYVGKAVQYGGFEPQSLNLEYKNGRLYPTDLEILGRPE